MKYRIVHFLEESNVVSGYVEAEQIKTIDGIIYFFDNELNILFAVPINKLCYFEARKQ